MKRPLFIIGFLSAFTVGISAYSEPFLEEKAANQESKSGEKSDAIEKDSTQVNFETEPQEPATLQKEVRPPARTSDRSSEIHSSEPSAPPEDQNQNNSPVSSFNFLYYLIEKFKFPDLLDDSF